MSHPLHSVEDLIANEQFVEWVKQPDDTKDAYWEQWLKENPTKIELVKEARQFLKELNFINYEPSVLQIKKMQTQIQLKTQLTNSKIPQIQTQQKRFVWRNIAAALLLLIGLWGIYQWVFTTHDTTYTTQFAEKQTIELPDGSTVILNANSTLDLRQQWTNRKNREIWLEGEAFFKVNSTPNLGKPKFIVHTDKLDIMVLGTQFNVSTRSDKVQVVLTEGKIDIQTKDASITKLLPGEKVELKSNEPTLSKEKVNTSVYTSWQTDRLFFEKTPFSQLVAEIENSYGYKVEIQDELLLNKPLSGSLPNSNLKEMLNAIAALFQIEVVYLENQTLVFKPITQ